MTTAPTALMVWIIILLLAIPYVRAIKHDKQKLLAAYLIVIGSESGEIAGIGFSRDDTVRPVGVYGNAEAEIVQRASQVSEAFNRIGRLPALPGEFGHKGVGSPFVLA